MAGQISGLVRKEESVEAIILDLYNGFQAEIKASVKWLD